MTLFCILFYALLPADESTLTSPHLTSPHLTSLTSLQKDRELQESLRLLSVSPAARVAPSPRVYDATVRNWFAVNGLPVDALEM